MLFMVGAANLVCSSIPSTWGATCLSRALFVARRKKEGGTLATPYYPQFPATKCTWTPLVNSKKLPASTPEECLPMAFETWQIRSLGRDRPKRRQALCWSSLSSLGRGDALWSSCQVHPRSSPFDFTSLLRETR